MIVRAQTLFTKSNPNITYAITENYFTFKDLFDLNQMKFKFAWTMEETVNINKSYDDPNYVIWKPVVKSQTNGFIKEVPLAFHKCNQTDFDQFWPPSQNFVNVIPAAFARNSFYCLDDNQNLTVYGIDSTDYARIDINFLLVVITSPTNLKIAPTIKMKLKSTWEPPFLR